MKDGKLEASDFLEPKWAHRVVRSYTYVTCDHPLFPMTNRGISSRNPKGGRSKKGGSILTSRFVVATYLSEQLGRTRILSTKENVYHIDGDSTNNELSNLKLVQVRKGYENEGIRMTTLRRAERLRELGFTRQAEQLGRKVAHQFTPRTRE